MPSSTERQSLDRRGPAGTETMTISIYGAGGECVIVEGCDGGDEHYSYEHGVRRARWRGDLVAPDGGMLRVYALFDGCWHLSIGQADRSAPIPAWPRAIVQHPTVTYSALLEIEAPCGTRLDNVWPRPDMHQDMHVIEAATEGR
jgi:hypothetical protein